VVQGTRSTPYRVRLHLSFDPEGELLDLTGRCDCPVGIDCKHAVAVLLALQDADTTRWPAARPARRGSPVTTTRQEPSRPWEELLRGLVGSSGPAGQQRDPRHGALALQVELTTRRVAGRGGAVETPGVRLRPVARGASGRWTRSGLSWGRLPYLRALPTSGLPPRPEQVRVLQELAALAQVGSTGLFLYGREETVWLEGITSRRVWDLLAQAEDLGVPLVVSGREPAPVVLHRQGLRPHLDLRQRDGGLEVRAELLLGDQALRAEGWLFVGEPPHGLVWWQGTALHLAGLSEPLAGESATAWRRLLGADTPVEVPAPETERFLGELLPTLRRRISTGSADGSVPLPELPVEALLLAVEHLPGPRIALRWEWGPVDGAWREPLPGHLPAGTGAGLPETVARTLAAAAHVAQEVPALGRVGPEGWQLAPEVVLEGMDAVRFGSGVLDRLRALPGLLLEETGEPAHYQAATGRPEIRLGGRGAPEGDWFDLAVEVEVGGEPVPFGLLFTALAEGREHLVLPSGTWFPLHDEAFVRLAAAIAEARALSDGPPGSLRVSRWQVGVLEDLGELAAPSAEAQAWLRSVRGLLADPAGRFPVPAALEATLRPYQRTGFEWLAARADAGIGGILADDMGLGKTMQALALVCHQRAEDPAAGPWLVVAPTSVVGNWVAECRRFAPTLAVQMITETTARRGTPLADLVEKADLVVSSYTLVRLDHDAYQRVEWAGILLDEAQLVKNPASLGYRRIRDLRAPVRFAMTGTPLENHLMELWALLSLCAPGLFPRADRFAEYYRVPIERGRDSERLALLRRRLAPVVLRRTKQEVAAELPPRQEQVLELELAPAHRRLYQAYLDRERQKVLGLLEDPRRNRVAILRSLTLLRQACLDVSLVDPARTTVPATKLDAVVPMIEQAVEEGHRVLVFSQFTRFLGRLRQRLVAAGLAPAYLDGRTRRRQEVIDRFRAGELPVFLVSLKAGGFGLNLVEADTCILLDPWWNPASEQQAIDRAHRIGQTRAVHVYRLVAKDTIEEKVMALKARKAALFAGVLDAGAFGSGALSEEDLRLLFDAPKEEGSSRRPPGGRRPPPPARSRSTRRSAAAAGGRAPRDRAPRGPGRSTR
jgi:superfamily II DNA or RNA helicase